MFDHQGFSRFMKVALVDYHAGENFDPRQAEQWIEELSAFNTKALITDVEKKACWINLYNGLTNYFIISRKIKETVWEVPGFFSELRAQVGDFDLSLDDIEHGILRKNGQRRNNKPRQFKEGDIRTELMVENFDPRIHFALNCGSISCPPLAFYSAEDIDRELSLAEQSFTEQEFRVDHAKQEIKCSEIFIWYRHDFVNSYLNDPDLTDYKVIPIPYRWTVH